METEVGVSKTISSFVVNSRLEEFPKDAIRVMLLSILDWVSVGHAGIEESVSKIVRNFGMVEQGLPESRVFGLDKRLPARIASMINGTTSHALDFDDTHFCYIGHPSVAVLPATLALSEKFKITGKKFLEASLIGVESACRIGSWLGRNHYQKGFHQTATAGTFGSTLAGCKLFDLNLEQSLNAIGIASTRASGLKSQFGTMGKPFNAGMAASNGVESCLLAKSGFISCSDGLECDQGFSDTHAGENQSLSTVFSELGKTFIFEDVLHKFHACCHGLHPSLEAFIAVRDDMNLKPKNIKMVKVLTNPRWERVCNISEPKTGLEAKFSFRHTIAMAINGKDTASLLNFTDESCSESSLVSWRNKVNVEFSDQIVDTDSIVQIETNDGKYIESSYNLSEPVKLDLREIRVIDKGKSLLGSTKAENLWEKIIGLSNSTESMCNIDLLNLV